MGKRVMVMAGGTGGHVFPALAVAEELRARGMDAFWLGTPDSFEAGVVPGRGFTMEWISIQGLRGKGWLRWLAAPFKIAAAMLQALRVVRRRRPQLVLGRGGCVTGPGGLGARILGIPLVIHEQNAVPGMTNKWLARIADRVLEAFPGSFGAATGALVTGNPVRGEIAAITAPEQRMAGREGPLRLLVLGGSQGAQALNKTLPQALAQLPLPQRPQVRHQAGGRRWQEAADAYAEAAVNADVDPFISDMASAYAWADLVICRAGALTIAELAAAGVGAILVPYPYAVDDHQTRNARYLVDAGAAILLPQSQMNAQRLADLLRLDRQRVLAMACAARRMGLPGATTAVADICQEAAA